MLTYSDSRFDEKVRIPDGGYHEIFNRVRPHLKILYLLNKNRIERNFSHLDEKLEGVHANVVVH